MKSLVRVSGDDRRKSFPFVKFLASVARCHHVVIHHVIQFRQGVCCGCIVVWCVPVLVSVSRVCIRCHRWRGESVERAFERVGVGSYVSMVADAEYVSFDMVVIGRVVAVGLLIPW